MTLYLHKHDSKSEYFLCSSRQRYTDDTTSKIYFHQGNGSLYAYAPTWFATKAEAVRAAESMGYTVEDMAGKA